MDILRIRRSLNPDMISKLQDLNRRTQYGGSKFEKNNWILIKLFLQNLRVFEIAESKYDTKILRFDMMNLHTAS